MGSFEWMELQTLTNDIGVSRTRLSAARANKDQRLAQILEEEIADAEKRRAELLAHLTTHIATDSEGVPEGAAGATASPGKAKADREKVVQPVEAEEEPPPLELVDRISGPGPRSPAPAPKADRAKGGPTVWDQVTPGDLDRAKQQLGQRRTEMLARHAEELKTLDADEGQLTALEQAINEFLRKFAPAPADGAVVVLGEERESRLQGRA